MAILRILPLSPLGAGRAFSPGIPGVPSKPRVPRSPIYIYIFNKSNYNNNNRYLVKMYVGYCQLIY